MANTQTLGFARAMTSAGIASGRTLVREVPLSELVEGSTLHAELMALHEPWLSRGMKRWLTLLSPRSTRPVMVLGDFEPLSGELLAAIVAVWHEAPCVRFDDLLERDAGSQATARPSGGLWHFISVTTQEDLGLGMGRALLGQMLTKLARMGHPHACSLSPIFDLRSMLGRWSGNVEDVVLHAAREDGRPVLQTMRLHLASGARLERVLHESRRDDKASLRVTLRFGYATDAAVRAQQKQRWHRWIAARAGSMSMLSSEFDTQALYRADLAHDAMIWDGVATS
jgi:hypothetical protein